jgi:sugar lactone lactonase YvrE
MAWDEQGRLHTGTADGRIVREAADGRFEEVARTGGRPLGLCFDGAGGLIVCDSSKGLLRLDREGRLVSLAKGAGGVAFGLTNAVAVARDGTLYFSDSSWKYPREHLLLDLLEARPYGRLLAYDPDRGQTRVLAGGLFFANGVALSRDESFVLVAETYRYRITRHWLKGPRAGVTDVFAENLPGFPDGVSWNGRDTFWVALYTTRDPLAERLQPRPWAKRLVARLPTALWGRPRPYGLVLALDEHGRVLRTLHEPEGRRLRFVTSARERQGALYLGTLEDPWLGRYTLPAPGSSR